MMVSPIVGRWPVVLRLSPGTRERQEEKDREREVGQDGIKLPPWGPLSREREHLR